MEHKEIKRKPFRGELALAVAVVINSFSVVLTLMILRRRFVLP